MGEGLLYDTGFTNRLDREEPREIAKGLSSSKSGT
jgi:hypothetical protein